MDMHEDLPDVGAVELSVIDGLRIRLARSGANQGIPILLTSPWPESLYAFRDLLPVLGRRNPLIALDLPGFGLSDSRPDVMSPEGMANFILQTAAHFGISRMHAIGPDIGTPSLLFAAAQRPDLFESLVVGGGATSPDLAAGQLKDLIASEPGAFAEIDGAPIGVEFVSQSARIAPPPAVLEDYRQASAGKRFEEATNFVRAYPRDLPRLERIMGGIETPVLILIGRDDPIVPPENGRFLAARLPRNRYVELDGGHLVWEDAPEAYAGEIERWLASGYRAL
jgi:pimeloyl-ACP methyl ester carboxylesterase